MKILLRAYGSHLMGMGHLFRIRKVFEALQENIKTDITVSVLTKDYEESKLFFSGSKIAAKFTYLPIDSSASDEISWFYSSDVVYDLIINDQLTSDEVILKNLNKWSKNLVGFDDLSNSIELYDLVFNILYPTGKCYKNEINDFGYCLVDSLPIDIINNKVGKIFLNQGGADTWGVIPLIINDLSSQNCELELSIVLGPSFQHYNELAGALESYNGKFIVYNHVSDIEEIVKSCDVAIVAGGNTLIEVVSLGIPTLSISLEHKELDTIKRVVDSQLIFEQSGQYGEWFKNIDLEKNIYNYKKRLSLNRTSKKYFTGNNFNNCINKILEVL